MTISQPVIKTTAKFEAAHRQLGDESKCGYLHGHNWMAEFVIVGPVNPIGYVVDFKDLKNIVQPYDHKVILQVADPLGDVLEVNGQRVCKIPLNPTCENLATIICEDVQAMARANDIHLQFISVTLCENQESSATVQWKADT